MKNPNLIDFLKFNARLQPNGIAIQSVHGHFTFSELLERVQRIAHKLRTIGVRPGQTVVVAIPDDYINWIVTLALTHEATLNASNHGHSVLESTLSPDWVVTDQVQPHYPAAKTILVDDSWLADTRNFASDIAHIGYPSGESPVRLVMTSGTTGERKSVVLSHNSVVGRAWRRSIWMCTSPTLVFMGLATSGGYAVATNALMSGFPFYCSNSIEEAVALIADAKITTLFASPTQYGALLEVLIEKSFRLPSVTEIHSGGGSMSAQLARRLREHVSPNIFGYYGSTECSVVCMQQIAGHTDPMSAGFIFPEAEIEVVDDAHQALPAGETGIIRMRTPFMAHQYHNNPTATAQFFRDGWFYPGDTGFIDHEEQLMLAGRSSELINCGGIKLNPMLLDHFLLDQPGIVDAAVFGYEDYLGVQRAAAAIVSKADVDISSLCSAVSAEFGIARTPVLWFKVGDIPRNAMGKAMRAELAKRLATEIRGQQPTV